MHIILMKSSSHRAFDAWTVTWSPLGSVIMRCDIDRRSGLLRRLREVLCHRRRLRLGPPREMRTLFSRGWASPFVLKSFGWSALLPRSSQRSTRQVIFVPLPRSSATKRSECGSIQLQFHPGSLLKGLRRGTVTTMISVRSWLATFWLSSGSFWALKGPSTGSR